MNILRLEICLLLSSLQRWVQVSITLLFSTWNEAWVLSPNEKAVSKRGYVEIYHPTQVVCEQNTGRQALKLTSQLGLGPQHFGLPHLPHLPTSQGSRPLVNQALPFPRAPPSLKTLPSAPHSSLKVSLFRGDLIKPGTQRCGRLWPPHLSLWRARR